ncbi:MAG: MgtC/SapB family protein [Lachnospiraceae bacterium]|nr:MgtC/SapB family protein [Lachnospiraceae bacterium]
MKEVINFLDGFSTSAVGIRLIIATLFGSLVGWERVTKKHNAGIKTFALVSLGSAVATILNIYLASMENQSADISRIPAGVVSGIGFLGAGMILVTGRNQIKGLTTAASLWVTSIMGMAIGGGFLEMGTICFVLIMISNRVLQYFSQRVEEHNRYLSVYLEVEKVKGVVRLRKFLTESGYSLLSMNKTKEKTLQPSDVAIAVELDLKGQVGHQVVIEKLNNLEYVNYLEEI